MSTHLDPPPAQSSSSSSPSSVETAPSTPYYPASLSLSHQSPPSSSSANPAHSTSSSTLPDHSQPSRHHSRRPSRAERYEHLVENARLILEKSKRSSGLLPSTIRFDDNNNGSSTVSSNPKGVPGGRRRSSYMSVRSGGSGSAGRRGSLGLIGERLGLGELGQYEPPTTTTGGGGEVGLGIQQDGEEIQSKAQVEDREWRETVRNLLLVVDGMSQQLATHDELAAQLKIAQSNLTLAETHSEFLEETLRRRELSNGASSGGVRNSTSMQRNGRSRTAEDTPGGEDQNQSTSSTGGGGARSFFRLPTTSSSSSAPSASSTKRKATVPPTALSFVSAQSTPALRSVASSPRLGGGTGNESPTMPTPLSPTDSGHPRFSTSTIASFDSLNPPPSNNQFRPSLSPNPSTQSLPNPPSSSTSPSLLQDFQSLQSAYRVLATECTALKVNEESLKRNNEMMVKKCADLEKTKEDLMSELENLSVELFSEANALVAEERRARAAAETKLEQLQTQLNSLTEELASLRSAFSRHSQSQSQLDASSPDLPAIPRNNSISTASPLSLLIPSRSSSSSASSSPNPDYSPSLVETPSTSQPATTNRPSSTASVVSTGRKWFSFGRSPSIPAAPSISGGTDSTASPNPSFSTPPLPSSSNAGAQSISDHSSTRTPSLSLSPYLDSTAASTPIVSTPATTGSGGNGLGIPMERNNSGSSFVTARSESWFGFGGSSNSGGRMSEEPQEIGGAGGLSKTREEDELSQEVIQTPVRSTFAPEVREASLSPRPPKKEVSPARGNNVNLSPKKQQQLDAPPPPPRPSSPSPSQTTIASTISSSNKDLPAKMASPPLPPLPPATPLSSALSSPVLDNGSVETDPTKLPFSSTSSSTSPPPVPRARTSRSGQAPRPLAIHIAASSSLVGPSKSQSPSSTSFLTCPSPSPSSTATTPATPNFVGGPTQSEMTAGARSPKSPNELRWKEAISTIGNKDVRAPSAASSTSRSRSRSGQSNKIEKENISSPVEGSFRKDVLPPSPQGGGGVIEAKKPLPPTTKDKSVPSIPPKSTTFVVQDPRTSPVLRIDTTLPEPISVTPRPTERGPRSARPSSSSGGISRPSLFRHHSTTANPSSTSKNALTPSFGSNSSISSQVSDTSTGGHSVSSTLLGSFKNSKKGAGKNSQVPLSPDGTKAVDDLEKLMESMLDMFE
ncbi:hypothetical protein JCM5350_007828 [Sporobolomyces pararoseus]